MSDPAAAVPQTQLISAMDPFHDHRWHEVVADPGHAERFLCDDCGLSWTL